MNKNKDVDSIVVRLSGDSGDGIQLMGSQFAVATALSGADFATFPDYPAEIRAPVGTTFGVSAYQINLGSGPITTPGDAPDVLVAFNPAALKVSLPMLHKGALVIVNSDSFTTRNLRKAGYDILLFNNEIYGLTKGQYSPTSRVGTKSPSSPGGSFETPVSPGQLALGAGAKFFARCVDTDKVGMSDVLQKAHAFVGASFVEIFQNCIVYNEDVFAGFTARKDSPHTQLHVKHGEPMLFGENNGQGIRFNADTWSLEEIDAVKSPGDVLVHDEGNAVVARMLIDLHRPVALGVIYRQPSISFEDAFYAHHPTRMKRTKSIANFIKGPSSWTAG